MIQFHYAIQTCDIASYQNLPRYCTDERSLLTKKSIASFLTTVSNLAIENKDTHHVVAIVDDRSSDNVKKFINAAKDKFQQENLVIEIVNSNQPGIANSIRTCYTWLETNGVDFVYQVQDDYIFRNTAIKQIADMWYKIYHESNTHAVITPYHDTYVWLKHYRNWASPRTFFIGKEDFWIQIYDIACTFFTSKEQFSKHWDLFDRFLYLVDNKQEDGSLENKSLNYMFTKRGVLGITPIRSLALHMQTELEKDPYIDWKTWWDNINIEL